MNKENQTEIKGYSSKDGAFVLFLFVFLYFYSGVVVFFLTQVVNNLIIFCLKRKEKPIQIFIANIKE